ncbi:hypothetical protein [Anabaena sp. 4-3]|uniref:hypothetical protein n=1 Tax=Anabaena sp. 4-3 TaxID=1811979 RepID=UPI0008315BC0|nr:hypothetical protein [Anabaena sp. 4-3]
MRFKGNWGCFQLFVSSLVTLIFINYLVTGFIDVVLNVNNLLEWVQKSGVGEVIYRMVRGR